MDEQNIIEESVPVQKFKGFTLDEIKYHRALTAVKKEYEKEKALRTLQNLRRRTIFGGFGKNKNSREGSSSLLSKVFNGMSYADYAVIGFSLFSNARKVWNLFHRKK